LVALTITMNRIFVSLCCFSGIVLPPASRPRMPEIDNEIAIRIAKVKQCAIYMPNAAATASTSYSHSSSKARWIADRRTLAPLQ
jgi:hypothetical protein